MPATAGAGAEQTPAIDESTANAGAADAADAPPPYAESLKDAAAETA